MASRCAPRLSVAALGDGCISVQRVPQSCAPATIRRAPSSPRKRNCRKPRCSSSYPLVIADKIQLIDQIAHEERQMILRQPLPQARRQQQILLGHVRAIGLGHRPKCSTTALARSLKTSVRGQDAQHTIRRSPDAQSNCHQEMSESPSGPALAAFNWGMVTRSLAQPYRVPVSMILLFALVPFYVLIPEFLPPRTRHVPELALDRALPLVPSWAIVYGALYLFLILLPIFVVRQQSSSGARSMPTC